MPEFAFEAVGGLTVRLVWLGLLHSLWLGLLAASVVALVRQSAPRLSHRTSHAILAGALLVAALGPIGAAACQHLAGPAADEVAATTIVVRTEGPSLAGSGGPAAESNRSPRSDAPADSPAPFAGRVSTRWLDPLRRARPLVLSIWSLAVAALGAILAVGAVGLGRLCRGAGPAPDAVRDRCRRLGRLLRLRRIPRILVHARLAEPFLCGVFRPTILLPEAWAGAASPRSLDAILAHELAHALRRDQVVNLAQRLVEVGLFFHPAVHWLSRSLRRERELCADALAVRLTGDPLALAEALQSVARLRLESPRIPAAGASLGGPSVSLLPRIQELIGMTPARPRFSLWPLAALPAAGFLALFAAAAGLAEDRPSAPAATPRVANTCGPPSANDPAHQPPSPFDRRTGPADVKFDSRVSDDDCQISYEVRFLVSPAESWRVAVGDRLDLIRRDGDVTAWTLDDKACRQLLDHVQRDIRARKIADEKVTSFNGARVSVRTRDSQRYVSGFEKSGPEQHGLQPIMKSLAMGWFLDFRGTIASDGTRLSVHLTDAWLAGLRTAEHREKVGAEFQTADFQVPNLVERKADVECNIPAGRHLLISTGPAATSQKDGRVNDPFPRIDGREPIRFVPCERLVLIGPRPIVLEPEEQAARPAPRAKPAIRKP